MASFRGVHGGLVKRGQTKRPVGIDDNNNISGNPYSEPHSASYSALTVLSGSSLLDNGLNSSTNGCNGYHIGNAKYIHLWVSGGAETAGVTLHGYNYDIGKWGKIEVPSGFSGQSGLDAASDSTARDGYTIATAKVGPGGEARMKTIELNGIDRIGLVQTGSAPSAVRASVSTI